MGQSSKPQHTPGAEAFVAYRNEQEFNTALDAAAERIRSSRRFDGLGWLWFTMFAIGAIFAFCQWVLGLKLHLAVIPGVNLFGWWWVALIVMAFVHHGVVRNFHRTVIRRRLCFECGKALLGVPTEDDRGACPDCGRRFALAQYRRPGDNRGRKFVGYVDTEHFNAVLDAASDRIRAAHGQGWEKFAYDWLWLGLLVSFIAGIFTRWSLFSGTIGTGNVHFGWLIVMLLWSAVRALRHRRLRPSIVEKRRCLTCGYSLLQMPVDGDGYGRCPECGDEFAEGEWTPPTSVSGDEALSLSAAESGSG